MYKKLLVLVFSVMAVVLCASAFAQYTVVSVPNPKNRGAAHYVSDPDGNLGANTIAELDTISQGIETANGSEFAIVVVNDYQGASAFDFALDLFGQWGIGKQGSNNGLLLFLAINRHEYRFISGYGVEGIFPDARLKQIGEQFLVPYLRAGNTDMAVLSAAKAVESVFLSPANELELAGLNAYQPTFWNLHAGVLEQCAGVLAVGVIGYVWLGMARKRVLRRFAVKHRQYQGNAFWYALFTFLFLLFLTLFVFVFLEIVEQVYQFRHFPYFLAAFGSLVLAYQYYGCRLFLQRATKDKKTAMDMQVSFTWLSLLPLLFAPFAYLAYFDLVKTRKNARLRAAPPQEAGDWLRLNRDDLTPEQLRQYLNKQQLQEERLDARSYEIWRDQGNGEISIRAFDGANFALYSVCPQCHGQTLAQPELKTIKAPTYSKTGQGERIQACKSCDYKKSLGMVTLPVLQSSSSSSSSGSGSSGGGGGGGSAGGSFGGGSSGGGGAGGRW